MKRMRPPTDDGEIDPKTSSWRSSQGVTTSRKPPAHSERRPPADARGARSAQQVVARRPARRARPAGRRRCEPGRPGRRPGRPGAKERRSSAQASSTQPQRQGSQQHEQREVVGLAQVRRQARRHGHEQPGRCCLPARHAGVATDEVGQWRDGCGGQPEGQAEAVGARTQQPDEGHLDQRRQRHPVRVRRDGQDALLGQACRRPRRSSRCSRCGIRRQPPAPGPGSRSSRASG